MNPEAYYSLGSQPGNAHLHWHIAGLPSGVPYSQQQFHALMTENGVMSLPPDEAAEMAARLRAAVVARGVLTGDDRRRSSQPASVPTMARTRPAPRPVRPWICQ
jgi:hypothetical protein